MESAGLFILKAFAYGLCLAAGFFCFGFFSKYADFYGNHWLQKTFHTPFENSTRTPCDCWNEEWFVIRMPILKISKPLAVK